MASSFQGLIPKSTLSQQHIKKLSSRVDDLKKASISLVEYFQMVNKGTEQYHNSTLKHTEAIEQLLNTDDERKRHLQMPLVFKSISISIHNFCKGLEASLKEYHVAVNVQLDELSSEHLDNATSNFRKYRIREENLLDSFKRYNKLQKVFNESLTSYKNSLSDVKLIYNKQQTLRRYQQCQTNLKNTITQQRIILDRSVKCSKDKRTAIESFNSLSSQFKNTYLFIGQKILAQAKNMMTIFSVMHKQIINDIASKKKAFEQGGRVGTFLDGQVVGGEYGKYFESPEGNCNGSGSQYPIFLEKSEQVKDQHLMLYGKWLAEYVNGLKEKSQTSQKLMKRIYSFLCEQVKIIEKMTQFMTKDVPQYYEKLRKRVQDIIGTKSVEYLKCINNTFEMSMKIYEKLCKTLNSKLEHISLHMAEELRLSDMFFKQLAQQILALNNKKGMSQEVVFGDLSEIQQSQLRSTVVQKSLIIKHFLNSFGERLNKTTELARNQLMEMINQIFSSFNQIYLYSTQYQQIYFGLEFQQGVKKCKTDMLALIDKDRIAEPIPNEVATQDICLDEKEKFKKDDYLAVKKPSSATDIKVLQEQAEGAAIEEPLKNSTAKKNSLDESKLMLSPVKMDEKEKKCFQFLKRKIHFEEGQKFVKAYSCALYDKIILQGKLYVTSLRLCFHSYFNASSLFFGNTFLQIPKKDIVKIQKRFNAIIFDNSLAVTTVNGQVFFTSFFKRNQAYKLVNSLFDLKCPQSSDEDSEEAKGEDAMLEDEIKEGSDFNIQTPAKRSEDRSDVSENREQKGEKLREFREESVESKEQSSKEDNVSSDITKEEQQKRTESFKQFESRKYKKVCQHYIDNVDCIFLLRNIHADKEITVNSVKYQNFYVYHMTAISQCQDYKLDPWSPDFFPYLTADNIKNEAPLKCKRKSFGIQPLPKTSIPFIPKTCQTAQQQTLYLISKDRFNIDAIVQSKGAPYTQSFIIHFRYEYENVEGQKRVKLTNYIDVQWVKSCMIKGTIESQSAKNYEVNVERYLKTMADRIRVELARQRKSQAIREENRRIVVEEVLPVESTVEDRKQEEIRGRSQVQAKAKKNLQPTKAVNEQTKAQQQSKASTQVLQENQKLKKRNQMLKIALLISIALHMLSILLLW